jgi:type IV pilus assembly protein PilV
MKSPRSTQRGILLLEALIAILLISFGILGLIALWANALKDVTEAKYRSDASFLANEAISQLWLDYRGIIATGDITSNVLNWSDRVKATLPDGEGTIVVDTNPDTTQFQATVTVQWILPGHVKHTFVTIAHINGAGPF